MPEIEAFEAVTVSATPSVVAYQGATYRSDRVYVDADDNEWLYVGLHEGDSMWTRADVGAAWSITAVVNQFGPLTAKPDPADRLSEIEARAAAATPGPWCTDSWEIYQGTEYEPGISQWIGETCRGTTSLAQDRADAAFVAAARTDVPWLLAQLRQKDADNAELTGKVASAEHQLERLDKELVRLRDALAAVLDACDKADQQYPTTGSPREPAIRVSDVRRAAGQTAAVTA